ncbi:unnamed protein product [Protopolystoma xenopodis]|uniref:Uncharacterized protein n=1 Tax=Protopolystoma xenopodis TaxID=117903 RepID=A0A448X5M3_9PLAT|nr:unnamed protein product [Protopolystoma xenopodis]
MSRQYGDENDYEFVCRTRGLISLTRLECLYRSGAVSVGGQVWSRPNCARAERGWWIKREVVDLRRRGSAGPKMCALVRAACHLSFSLSSCFCSYHVCNLAEMGQLVLAESPTREIITLKGEK